jgi:hypothetical protein
MRISTVLLLALATSSSHADLAPATQTVHVQIDSPFSPFRTKTEERAFAVRNDHARGARNPLPELRVEIDDQVAFAGQLTPRGSRMTHVWFGQGSAELPRTAEEVTLRVVVESQQIDHRERIALKRGAWLVIAQDGKRRVVVRQYRQRPLYR